LPKYYIVVDRHTGVGDDVKSSRSSKMELQVMEVLWKQGRASIREVQEAFPEKKRQLTRRFQTLVYRREGKQAGRRVRKVGNFHIFEAAVSRELAQRKLVDDFLALFGGRTQPVMAHGIESGRLTLADVKEAEKILRSVEEKERR